MTDNEKTIFSRLSIKIKEKYPNVQISNQKLPMNQTVFPAISIILTNNEVIKDYSTFDQMETVSKETFEFEVANSHDSGMDDVKAIFNIIDEDMKELAYQRSYIGLIDDKEITDARRLARYEKLITK